MSAPRVLVFSQTKGMLQEIQRQLPNELSKLHIDSIDIPNNETETALSEESLFKLNAAEILVTEPAVIARHKLLYSLPNLKWMQSTWAGVDAMLKGVDPEKPPPSYTLSRFAGYFGAHMAEYVVGQIISRERGFSQLKNYQQRKIWPGDSPSGGCKEREYRLLSQLNIAILGVGSIGKEVAKACKTFGMTVQGLVSKPITEQTRCSYVDTYRQLSELPAMLKKCDYICNILPSTSSTRGLLSGNVLNVAEKAPCLINVGRGDIISENTVIEALKNGWLSHAILDVFPTEPLPSTSALWEHPAVTITPHLAALSFSWQVAELFSNNLQKYMRGESVDYVVDWTSGY